MRNPLATRGQGGADFVPNAIPGPRKDKRTATVGRIAIVISRTGAPRPHGLGNLAACALTGAGQEQGTSPSRAAGSGPVPEDFVDMAKGGPDVPARSHDNRNRLRRRLRGPLRCDRGGPAQLDDVTVAPGVGNGAHHTYDCVGAPGLPESPHHPFTDHGGLHQRDARALTKQASAPSAPAVLAAEFDERPFFKAASRTKGGRRARR